MGILRSIKSKKKEYMKYEDGRIVPVQVDAPKHYEEWTASDDDNQSISETIKETISLSKETTKRHLTHRNLKIVATIVVLILFAFTVKNLYTAFHTSATTKTNQSATQTTKTFSENPVSKSTAQTSVSTTTKSSKPAETSSSKTVDSQTGLKSALMDANAVNSVVATDANQEIQDINTYNNNLINLDTLTQALTSAQTDEQQAWSNFIGDSSLFTKEGISDYYQITSQRLQNAMALSQNLLNGLNNMDTSSQIDGVVNGFVQKESALKKQQNTAFIKLLKANKIPYQENSTTDKINYTL